MIMTFMCRVSTDSNHQTFSLPNMYPLLPFHLAPRHAFAYHLLLMTTSDDPFR